MPPVVSIIGRSKSGKTTLVEKLVTELKQRGYRVATIKHAQEIDFIPGKDSWRHLNAGSKTTMVVSPDEAVLIKPITNTFTFSDICRLLGEDYDIILTEGFKQADTPKIEVRYGVDNTPLKGIKRLVAVVSDESMKTDIRHFSSGDTAKLADLLEEGFIKPQRSRLAVYVNSRPLTLKSFPKRILGNLITSMVCSLKGVKEVSSLDIFIRRKSI